MATGITLSSKSQLKTNPVPASHHCMYALYALPGDVSRGWQVMDDEVDVARLERNMDVCMVVASALTSRCRVPGSSDLSLPETRLAILSQERSVGIVSRLIVHDLWVSAIGAVCVNKTPRVWRLLS
jgi:hypothetical protein